MKSFKTIALYMIFFFFVSINSFAQRAPQIYIAGYDGNDAVYWLNGELNFIEKSYRTNSMAFAIAIME